ncbi:DUF3592 domain-containing protein [Catenuloplanes atrovinosus]|uniref:DUF3592 domain-containing protein n=1 Tax=Catenuloplanes atrovinosus TaxID=137266 RepID=A0AAE3YTL6_9ACTN|nr:DUF3592 domain-containing protein [Catenuloplanes atrovinosus]MDR7278410.1 hypothetical protein [Catenuloplanes atrovinosus]
MSIAVGVPFLLLGAAVAAAWTGVTRHRTATALVRTGRRVPGEIVDVRRVTSADGTEGFTPVVRFRTRNDHEVIAQPRRGQTAATVRGNRVTVIYDESRPTRIMVDGAGFVTGDRRAALRLAAHLAAGAVLAGAAVAIHVAAR